MPDYRAATVQAARAAGIDPGLFSRMINQESGFNPNARSGAGADGIAQIVPRYHPDAPPASDPVGQLNWAARYVAGLVKQYGGSYAKALSVYNSGKPGAYLDPSFAQGQTYNYVKNILGGAASSPASPGASSPTVTPNPINALGQTTDRTSVNEGIQALLGLAQGRDPVNLLTELSAAPTLTAPPVAPTAVLPVADTSPVTGGTLKLTPVPVRLSTRAGIEVNSSVLPQVAQIAQRFGVRVNSGWRSAQHNAAVGGAGDSDHLRGNAVDFVGSPAQMRALYQWAQGRFPYVEPWDQAHGDHVHISFIRSH